MSAKLSSYNWAITLSCATCKQGYWKWWANCEMEGKFYLATPAMMCLYTQNLSSYLRNHLEQHQFLFHSIEVTEVGHSDLSQEEVKLGWNTFKLVLYGTLFIVNYICILNPHPPSKSILCKLLDPHLDCKFFSCLPWRSWMLSYLWDWSLDTQNHCSVCGMWCIAMEGHRLKCFWFFLLNYIVYAIT